LRLANISANADKPKPHRAAVHKAACCPFVFVMYAYATGGPFGLEDMVTTSGPGLTRSITCFIPLSGAFPVAGGGGADHGDPLEGDSTLGARGVWGLWGF